MFDQCLVTFVLPFSSLILRRDMLQRLTLLSESFKWHRSGDHRAKHLVHAGFTLLELLVVMIIIAIITVVVIVSWSAYWNPERRLRLMIENTRSVVRAARLRAILQPAVLALVLTPTGYRFYTYHQDHSLHKGTWQPLHQDYLSYDKAYTGAQSVRIITENRGSILGVEGHLSSQTTVMRPAVIFWPSGRVTHFTLLVTYGHKNYQFDM